MPNYTPPEYLEQLFLNTGVNASAADMGVLVSVLNGVETSRGSVLQRIIDGVYVASEAQQVFTTSYGQAFFSTSAV